MKPLLYTLIIIWTLIFLTIISPSTGYQVVLYIGKAIGFVLYSILQISMQIRTMVGLV